MYTVSLCIASASIKLYHTYQRLLLYGKTVFVTYMPSCCGNTTMGQNCGIPYYAKQDCRDFPMMFFFFLLRWRLCSLALLCFSGTNLHGSFLVCCGIGNCFWLYVRLFIASVSDYQKWLAKTAIRSFIWPNLFSGKQNCFINSQKHLHDFLVSKTEFLCTGNSERVLIFNPNYDVRKDMKTLWNINFNLTNLVVPPE